MAAPMTACAPRTRAGARVPWRCVSCAAVFPSYARWEAHADEAGHHRGEAVCGPGKAMAEDRAPGLAGTGGEP